MKVIKFFYKMASAAFLLLAAGLVNCGPAAACTAVYVGKGASADGTTIMAKSNDYGDVFGNHIVIEPAVKNKAGRKMPIDQTGTVFTEIPATTYKYVCTPWMDSTMAYNGLCRDATICSNERGVNMLMSITAFSNEAALQADPLIEKGLTEFTAVDLVVCQSATAREAVKVLCGLLDKFGSSEINIALIADQNEAWYVEMYSGYQYAAVKLPDDKVCAFGNEFCLEYLSDYQESIVSPNLLSLPAQKGFAVYGKNNELNLYKTYSGPSITEDYSHIRTWIGHKILSPSVYAADYDKEAMYPLCFASDKKVSLQDVMEIMRNRFEGTKYDPDETGRTDMRVIGTDTALSVHIVQVYHDVPADISSVIWESSGPAIYGVFVPVSNASLRAGAAYAKNQDASAKEIFDTDNYPYYRFKELTTLCVERDSYKTYGQPVRSYWHEAESGMAEGMAAVVKNAAALKDKKVAARYITDYCAAMQDKAFYDAGKLLNQVRWNKSKNCNTLKNGRNPETGEILDELRVLPPIEVKLDGSLYKQIPQVVGGGISVVALVLIFAALAVVAALLFLSKRAKRQ